VPAGRIAEFYEMHGGAAGEPSLDPATQTSARLIGFRGIRSTTRARKEGVALFPKRAQLVFTTLIDNPGKQYSGDDLAAIHTSPTSHGLAGYCMAGRYLYKLGRCSPPVVPNPEGGLVLHGTGPRRTVQGGSQRL